MARVHSMIVELLLDEPRSQLLGYSHVNDEAGMQMPHVSLWSLTDVRIMLNCIQVRRLNVKEQDTNEKANIFKNYIALITQFSF